MARAALEAAEAAAAKKRSVSADALPTTQREVRRPNSGSAHRSPGIVAPAEAARGTARGLRQGGKAAWRPVARISSVLWLEITGVLFAMFTFVAGAEAWRGRAALLAGEATGSARSHEFAAIAMLLGFGYFTASNFMRARRRGQQP